MAAPSDYDEAAEIASTNAAQQSLQQNSSRFDERREIENANRVRFSLQQGRLHTPTLSDTFQREESVVIKQEPTDSDMPSTMPSGVRNVPVFAPATSSSRRDALSHDTSTIPSSNNSIAEETNTAASLLRKFDAHAPPTGSAARSGAGSRCEPALGSGDLNADKRGGGITSRDGSVGRCS